MRVLPRGWFRRWVTFVHFSISGIGTSPNEHQALNLNFDEATRARPPRVGDSYLKRHSLIRGVYTLATRWSSRGDP